MHQHTFCFLRDTSRKVPRVRTLLGYMWQQWSTDEWSLVSVSAAANQSSCPRYTANTSSQYVPVPATLGPASHQLHCSDIIECSPSVNEHSNIILLLCYILVKVYNGQYVSLWLSSMLWQLKTSFYCVFSPHLYNDKLVEAWSASVSPSLVIWAWPGSVHLKPISHTRVPRAFQNWYCLHNK